MIEATGFACGFFVSGGLVCCIIAAYEKVFMKLWHLENIWFT